jgi:hypothetical protein
VNKYLLAYAAGVVTAPAWFYVFRKPLIDHIIVPIFTDDKLDGPLYNVMMARNDLKDEKKKKG